jgi:hypothetical protein
MNKRLVKILNSKIFKGYRITKEAKNVILKKPRYIEDIYWESKTLDPFDDFYNIEYKRKNLSCLNKQDFSNMLQVNRFSSKSTGKNDIIKKINVPIQKGESFRKRKYINLRKYLNNNNQDKYFYFSPNSQFLKKNSKEIIENKEKLYNTIFQNDNEKGLYNDIPIFAIEKIYKVYNNIDKKKYKYIKNKEERLEDLQFLYKLSHEKPKKKIDFRIKYNIKSAKSSSIINNEILKKATMNDKSKSSKNLNKMNLSQSIFFSPNFSIVNSSLNISRIHKEFKRNYSSIERKKYFNEIGTQSKEPHLFYSASTGNLLINQKKFFNQEKKFKNEKKSYSFIYPNNRRIINDQVVKDKINFQKWRFNKLKNLMEI